MPNSGTRSAGCAVAPGEHALLQVLRTNAHDALIDRLRQLSEAPFVPVDRAGT